MSTKKTFFILSTLLIIPAIKGMETKKDPRFVDALKDPLTYYNYKTNLTGIITLKDNAMIGYGSKRCIRALNKVNIPTEQQWPLVPIDVFIPNPKTHDHDKQTYTNWTLQTPSTIKKEISNLIDAEINKEEQKLADRCGAIKTLQNLDQWDKFNIIASRIRTCTQNTKPLLLPALIPVHILMSPPIQLNLFKCCQTTLAFNEHEMLEKLMEKFHHAPQASFSMLDEGTTKNIKFLELMVQRHNMPNSPADGTRALEQKIIANLMKQSNQTNKELEEAQIIHTPFQWWQSPELYLIDTTIGAMVIEKSHTHGKNGCSRDAFRNLLLKNELKGQNPFTIINNRAMNG